MIILYCTGIFIRSSKTDETKYIPMICAKSNTMMLELLLDDILLKNLKKALLLLTIIKYY